MAGVQLLHVVLQPSLHFSWRGYDWQIQQQGHSYSALLFAFVVGHIVQEQFRQWWFDGEISSIESPLLRGADSSWRLTTCLAKFNGFPPRGVSTQDFATSKPVRLSETKFSVLASPQRTFGDRMVA